MNTSFFNMKRLGVAAALSVAAFTGATTEAFAHGERAQEPFLRMRSVHWYDTEWTKDTVAINDIMMVRGKVHFSPQWSWPTRRPQAGKRLLEHRHHRSSVRP